MTSILAYCSEANQGDTHFVYTANYIAQTFKSSGGTLSNAMFWAKTTGSPSGNIVCKIYATTGTYGTDSKPTGSALATSDTVNVSSILTTYSLINFVFSGANKITLVDGTAYALTMEGDVGTFNNMIIVGRTASSLYPGDTSRTTTSGSSWVTAADTDSCFYVFGVPRIIGNYPPNVQVGGGMSRNERAT